MVRMVGLDDDLAGALGAAGPARDLDDLLGQPLGGAEISAEQALVGVDDGYQRHVRQMVAFGQHLGADQNPALAAVRTGQQSLHGALAAGGIAVDADQPMVGKARLQFLLQAFGALAERAQLAAAAARAGRWQWPLVAAMVAAQAPLTLVQGEPGVAAGAGTDPGAGMAEQRRREAAAIEKGQYLPALVQVLAHAGQQRFRQPAVERLAADVEDLGARHLRAAGPRSEEHTSELQSRENL